MTRKILISFFALALATGCVDTFDKTVCGEPKGKQKEFIKRVNLKFGDKFTIKHLPCYTGYMQIDLKSSYDSAIIDSLEKSYNSLVNYAEFLVYDKDGKLIRGNTGSM